MAPEILGVAALLIAGAVIMIARDARIMLAALAIHTGALASLVAPSAGMPMSIALAIGNLTAIAVTVLGLMAEEDTSRLVADTAGRSGRRGSFGPHMPVWRRGQVGFLQGVSALLAAVVAYGLADKPIPGTTEASAGLPSFIAYWSLAAGLMIVVLNRDILKIGLGLIILVNAGQVSYLLSARYLQSLVMIAASVVVVALALAVSRLLIVRSRLGEVEEEPETTQDSPRDEEREHGDTPLTSEI